jgi:hypothetical protein
MSLKKCWDTNIYVVQRISNKDWNLVKPISHKPDAIGDFFMHGWSYANSISKKKYIINIVTRNTEVLIH